MDAFRLAPRNAYGQLAVAEACQGLGRFEEACSYFEAAATEPKLAGFSQRGILGCLGAQKKWELILEKLTDWDPAPSIKHSWQVRALEGLGRFEEAMAACSRWLEAQPDHRAALWTLTELEIRRDGLEPVLARLERLSKIGSRPSIYKEIYASLCRRAGRQDKAIETYASLSRTTADPRILSKQAFALAKSGKEDQALPLLEALLRDEPENVYLHACYRSACARIGQLERALSTYEALLETHPRAKSLYGRIRGVQKAIEGL